MAMLPAPAPTLETLLDEGTHKHLKFSRRGGYAGWEIVTFPHGMLIRTGGGDFSFSTRAEDIIASFLATEADPEYWAEKLTAGTARVWDESAFREWLSEEAADLGVEEEVEDLLEYGDLHSEAHAREALSDCEIEFPEVEDFYALSPRFLLALEWGQEGLLLYTAEQTPTRPLRGNVINTVGNVPTSGVIIQAGGDIHGHVSL